MKTYKIEIEKPRLNIRYDKFAENPRNFNETLGYWIVISSRHISPDNNEILSNIIENTQYGCKNVEEHKEKIKRVIKEEMEETVIYINEVSMYCHSGCHYKLGNIQGWDWSMNGFYIITDKTLKEYKKFINPDIMKEDFEKTIENEIETYNKWLNNEYLAWELYNENGKMIDSGGGYKDLEEIKAEAR